MNLVSWLTFLNKLVLHNNGSHSGVGTVMKQTHTSDCFESENFTETPNTEIKVTILVREMKHPCLRKIFRVTNCEFLCADPM